MRGRLAFAGIAVVGAIVLVAWGLLPASSNSSRTSANAGSSADVSTSSPGASARASASPSPSAPALTKNMHLALDATFTGSKLDTTIWDTCYPWANQSQGCTNFDNTNETEWYMPSQVTVSNGELNLTARKAATPGLTKSGASKEYACRSGMVTTHPGFNFEYGYVQVVAHITNGSDLWPALWLAASNYDWPPEIDLLEHWGPPTSISGVYFHPVSADQVVMRVPKSVDVTSGWHTFAVDWTASKVTWYLDGQVILTVTQHVPHQKMYFIANVAAFVDHGQDPCTGTLRIRSVEVWQP